ncbi:MAG: tRNA threonylcarbamoyladenosine biosynthesis protein [Acidimicrobiales bacterium]|nr:MAG: tRNA threonylcarbamoyladenosine biosynthesis protein [Acidimicrobiales bacterium]
MALAVEVLRSGGLVAIPTETVYGLAADASQPEAVERIFEVKGRPRNHPLIVHLADVLQVREWVAELPELARRLADAFWPGPLTIVLPKSARVPHVVTGGLETVAVRVPAHTVTRRLLVAFGGGLAAPSANRFGRVSPTCAADVVADLGGAVDLVLDGGRSDVGVESTIVEVVEGAIRLLRPGGVTVEAIEALTGIAVETDPGGRPRAPGMLPSHYAPRTEVVACELDEAPDVVERSAAEGLRVAVIAPRPIDLSRIDSRIDATRDAVVWYWDAGGDEESLSHQLYARMREADVSGADRIVAVLPTPQGLGRAVRDRMTKAAGGR